MSTITWLHISDLHWRPEWADDENIVAQALLRDLEARSDISPDLAQIDFCFVTGDLADSGKGDEYVYVEHFLRKLVDTAGIEPDNLFVVPGNHDVDWDLADTNAAAIIQGLTDRRKVNALLRHDFKRARVLERFNPYREFVNRYLTHIPLDVTRYFYVYRRPAGGKRVAILGLNSAWTTPDRGRLELCLGDRQIDAALSHPNAQDADLCIALLHHPFEWLNDTDRAYCERRLLRGCHFVLHGHLHQTGIVGLHSPDGEAMVIQAGACYQTERYPLLYNLVQLNLQTGQSTVYLRRYSGLEADFWAEDNLTYKGVQGRYDFSLPPELGPFSEPGPSSSSSEEPETSLASHIGSGTSSKPGKDPDLVVDPFKVWWAARGYSDNPFGYGDLQAVKEAEAKRISGLLGEWYIDPNPEEPELAPTLDKVISKDGEPLGLVFAKRGSGKTFYRLWAKQQFVEDTWLSGAREGGQKARWGIDIPTLWNQINANNATGEDLARVVYQRVYRYAVGQEPIALPDEYGTAQILRACDEALIQAPPERSVDQLYVFVDGVGRLFDERRPRQNSVVLRALSELCQEAAKRQGMPVLLRIFVPLQFRDHLLHELGTWVSDITQCTLEWNADLCWQIIEARLAACYEGLGTPIAQVWGETLEPVFRDWMEDLERGQALTPRCVLYALDGLAHWVYKQDSDPKSIRPFKVDDWNEYLASIKDTRRRRRPLIRRLIRGRRPASGTNAHCLPEPHYPLS